MAATDQTVFIVDDDDDFRDSMKILCESMGFNVDSFDAADAFLEQWRPDQRGCLVLDIRMPRMSGLELQRELQERDSRLPIVFVTGHGDVPMAVKAMKAGAYDFLAKPFSHQELLDLVNHALEGEERTWRQNAERDGIALRFERLTPRESEVMDLVVQGLANKVIANRLGISQRTVEIHRAQVMEKMAAESLAELVRMAVALEERATEGEKV